MRKLRTLKTGENIFVLSMHEMKFESYYKMAIEYLDGKIYAEKGIYTEYAITGDWKTLKGSLISTVDTVGLIADLHNFYKLESIFVLSESECETVYKITCSKKLYKLGECTIDGFLSYFIKNVLHYNIFVVKTFNKMDLCKATCCFILNLYTRYNNKYFKVIGTTIYNNAEVIKSVTSKVINNGMCNLINEGINEVRVSNKYIHCNFESRDKLLELTNLFNLDENRSLLTSNISKTYGLLRILINDSVICNIHVYDFVAGKMKLVGAIEDYKLFTSYLHCLGVEGSYIYIKDVNYSRFKDDTTNWMLDFSNTLKERTLNNLKNYSETIIKDARETY